MKWIKFKNTFEEMEKFQCGTMLMLKDGSTIMLGDNPLFTNYDIIYYSNELVDKVKQIKNPTTVHVKNKNIEIATLLAQGLICKEIGAKTKSDKRAVEQRVVNLRKTFGCKNIPQLVYVLAKSNVI